VPRDVVLLTAAVDVQDNRLEAEICGWGIGEESWSIEYRIFSGSPSLAQCWMDLTDWLQEPRRHVCGMDLRVEAVGVDTGGHHTKEAYLFIEKYRGVIFAFKGSSQDGAPPIPKRDPKLLRNWRFKLYLLGTNALKDTIMSRMKMLSPGPGYMHFPRRDGYDEDYFKGLASEVKTPKYKPRSSVQVGYFYDKVYTRNEPLDLKVYNLAALLLRTSGKMKLSDFAKRIDAYVPQIEIDTDSESSAVPQPVGVGAQEAAVDKPEPAQFVKQYNQPRRRGGGFVKGWR
jgi:phage terminase large subunit GpA-like protein